MKNRKLNQLLVAGMISAAMMASGISVQAADFSDDTSTVEEQSVGSAEEEAPEVDLNFSLMLLKHHQQQQSVQRTSRMQSSASMF